MQRDLPGAIEASRKAFEQIRYNYEKGNENHRFIISDLPTILNRVILEMKPEWRNLYRPVKEMTGAPLDKK